MLDCVRGNDNGFDKAIDYIKLNGDVDVITYHFTDVCANFNYTNNNGDEIECCYDGSNAKYVAAGATHSLIITDLSEVVTFGTNYYGELGLGNDYTDLSYTYPHNVYGERNEIFSRYNKNLENEFNTKTAADLSKGVILVDDGHLVGFGTSSRGELSKDEKENTIFDFDVTDVSQVTGSSKNIGIITNSGKAKTIGDNEHGQLGDYNSVDNSGTDTGQDGSSNVFTTVYGGIDKVLYTEKFDNNAIKVDGGNNFNLILTDSGIVIGYGKDASNILVTEPNEVTNSSGTVNELTELNGTYGVQDAEYIFDQCK